MLKLVIVTSDLLSSKELINQCIGKIPSLQIIGILTSKLELEYYQKNSIFDILLFHNFDYSDCEKANYDIICIDKFKTPVKNYENRISLSDVNSFVVLKKRLEKFIKKVTESSIRQKATQTLLDLGFRFKHIGTKYILDAICYSYMNKGDNSFENMEKDVYPYIAKLNHTQVPNVKWSIARTINLMYLNHTTKSILKLEEYFCLDHLQKPTPKLVISVIYTRLLSDSPNNLNLKPKKKV